MLIAQVQFAPWDKVYSFNANSLKIAVGGHVIVDTELGKEFGKVLTLIEEEVNEEQAKEYKNVIRVADDRDFERVGDSEKKEGAMETCRELIHKHDLPMKLVDVHFSFEGNRINFAFVADNRIDFRELVKDLAGRLGANIRLTQIGTRDEAKACGDCGPCGRGLCCSGHIKEFSSITSEMAETQQVVHRGSDRISGMCGRLMCCLSYEYEGYKEMAGKLPPIGTKVNVDGVRGEVVGHQILKQVVDVKVPGERKGDRPIVISVDINRREKEKKAEEAQKQEDRKLGKKNVDKKINKKPQNKPKHKPKQKQQFKKKKKQ